MATGGPEVIWGPLWGPSGALPSAKERPLAITDSQWGSWEPRGARSSSSGGTQAQLFQPDSISRLREDLIISLRANPSLQKLVDNYEAWERNYRKEAETRLGGFKPLTQALDSQHADEWQLLRKVKQQRPSQGGGMKRSASEGSLAISGGASGSAAGSGGPAEQRARASQRVHLRHEWDMFTAFSPEANIGRPGPGVVLEDEEEQRGEQEEAGGGAAASFGGRFPRVTTAPALRDSKQQQQHAAAAGAGYAQEEDEGGLGSSSGNSSSNGLWAAGGGGGVSDEGARQLEAVAARLLAQSRQAIQNAQQTLQETANNCSANLQTLGALLQQVSMQTASEYSGMPRSGSGGSISGLQVVPWQQRPGAAMQQQQDGSSSDVPRFFRPSQAGGSGDGAAAADGGSSSSQALVLTRPSSLDNLSPEQQHAVEAAAAAADSSYQAMSDYLDAVQARKRSPAQQQQQQQKQQQPSLRDPGRNVAIVTTASLPWMTGTAVNPLLRAAYLAKNEDRQVTLMLPWLSKDDQERVFPNSVTFDSPADQEAFVREWAQKRTGLACSFKVRFYPGRYAPEKGSILPVGDITRYIPDAEADVAVLEEPEHLNWYHHGRRWTDKFRHVVGVMHTNYLDYARREEGGAFKEALLKHINAWVCRIYCHKVVKLSDAVQQLPRQETMFVHGVSPNFLQVGEAKAEAAAAGQQVWNKGAYFLGKVLWAKGYTELLQRLGEHAVATGHNVPVDVFGAGPDLPAVAESARERALNLTFNGPRDHADADLQDYKVFINPSLSDVVATTTAEALAMGKWVVAADHPSNKFFSQFPNCLLYRTPDEFTACLWHAMSRDPLPLSPEQLRKLTWEDATDRFLEVAELRQTPPLHEQLLDGVLAAAHQVLTGIEPVRALAGAGSNTRDSPANVTDYQPSQADVGGWFDDAARAKRIYGSSSKQQPQQQPPQQVVLQLQVGPLAQQQAAAAGITPAGGSAASLAAAVAAADAEASQEAADAAAAAGGSSSSGNGGRRWRLRRQRSSS